MRLSRSLACLVAVALSCIGADASAQGAQPLTKETLAEAIAFGQNGEESEISRLASPYSKRLLSTDFEEYRNFPYFVYVLTPFATAARMAQWAKLKYRDLPTLTPDELNAKLVQIDVSPSANFSTAGTIENVVLKRGDQVIRPLATKVTPMTIRNRMGGSRESANGVFTFPFEAFAPSGPLTIVLIGRTGNVERLITVEELAALR